MPRAVKIKVYCTGQTRVNFEQMRDWLDDLGVSAETIHLLLENPELTDSDIMVATSAKQCYMSFEEGLNPNVTKFRKDMVVFIDNILASGHGSVLEHVYFTFAINNVSRVFTGEMNRHRAGVAISERSMRYIRYQDCVPYWVPTSLQPSEDDSPELSAKKEQTRDIFYKAFSHAEDCYRDLIKIWDIDNPDNNFAFKKHVTSCLRRILPMGIATGGKWTLNIRALRHVLALRTSPAAEEEIALVCSEIAEYMVATEPRLFGDFEQRGLSWIPKYQKV